MRRDAGQIMRVCMCVISDDKYVFGTEVEGEKDYYSDRRSFSDEAFVVIEVCPEAA